MVVTAAKEENQRSLLEAGRFKYFQNQDDLKMGGLSRRTLKESISPHGGERKALSAGRALKEN